jgi:uncharacterized membrane protein YGL010W
VRWELLHGYGVSCFLLLLVSALAASASTHAAIKFTFALVVVGWLEKNMQKSAECIPHIKLDNEYILM